MSQWLPPKEKRLTLTVPELTCRPVIGRANGQDQKSAWWRDGEPLLTEAPVIGLFGDRVDLPFQWLHNGGSR